MGNRLRPRVSVCVPTRNYGRFLSAALNSILSQDFTDYELLIIDNASTDNTRDIVASFRDSRIRYLRNKVNIGFVLNSNLCLEQARGEYIKFLHADDMMAPGALREFVTAIAERPHIALVHSWTEFMDARGASQGVSPYPAGDREWPGWALIADSLSTDNFIGGHSLVMFRAEAARCLRGFNSRFTQLSDWDLWVRLLLRSHGYSLARPLVRYRVHEQTITAQTLRTNRAAYEEYSMLNNNPALAKFPGNWLNRFYWRVHIRALLDIRAHIAVEAYRAALQICEDIRGLDRFLPVYQKGGSVRAFQELWRLILKRSTLEEVTHFLGTQSDALAYRHIFALGMPLNIEPFDWARSRRYMRVALIGAGTLAQMYRAVLEPAGVQVVTFPDLAGNQGGVTGTALVRRLVADRVDAVLTAADSRLTNRLIRRSLLDRLSGHYLADRIVLGLV